MKDEDEFAFALQHGAYLRSICKWIIDSEATKHMTSHRATFDAYEVFSPRNVCLDDDSMTKAIGMGPLLLELK